MRKAVAVLCLAGLGSAFAGGWTPSGEVKVEASGAGETMAYAAQEAARLIGRVGAKASTATAAAADGVFVLRFGAKAGVPSVKGVKFDGFAVEAGDDGVVLAAPTAKGVLNGVYTLAEEAGFSFVYPGERGELAPAAPRPVADGVRTVNPRFPYRGLFDSNGAKRLYDYADWMAFLAKLRHNIYRDNTGRKEALAFCRKLGFRPEIGGHGMRDCLPRKLFETEPELFRMFMPEDFGGRRMKDSNFCISNPKTQRIVEENFTKMVAPYAAAGYHALHAWADDLPGNGWCMCSSCRSMEGTDQSQLAMNVEARAIRKAGFDMRVPAIGYHDTLFPSELVDPDPLCFFLYAPRERCYGHAIDDPSCARNAYHLKALKAWQRRYAKNDDAHTFEYYSDRMLFRGHTPYLPDVLVGDAEAYAQHGIEAWMTLVVGGEMLAPDWNLLGYSRLGWERHTRKSLTERLAASFPADDRETWCAYLGGCADAYQKAFLLCEQPAPIYLDFRWMPERGGAVGRVMVQRLDEAARTLDAARQALSGRLDALKPGSAAFARMEVARDAFQVTDLRAMAEHQDALREIGDWRNDGDDRRFAQIRAHLEKACALVEQACDELRPLILQPGEKDSSGGFKLCYYLSFAKGWTIPEMKKKINLYR